MTKYFTSNNFLMKI